MIEFVKANWNWLAPALGGVLLLAYPQLATVFGKLKNFIPLGTSAQVAAGDGSLDLDVAWEAIKTLDLQNAAAGVSPSERKRLFVEAVARLKPEAE